MLTQSGDFKLSVNFSSGISLALRVFRLHSFNFLAPSSWFELPLRSLFYEFRSKYLVISVRLRIMPTYINCMQEKITSELSKSIQLNNISPRGKNTSVRYAIIMEKKFILVKLHAFNTG